MEKKVYKPSIFQVLKTLVEIVAGLIIVFIVVTILFAVIFPTSSDLVFGGIMGVAGLLVIIFGIRSIVKGMIRVEIEGDYFRVYRRGKELHNINTEEFAVGYEVNSINNSVATKALTFTNEGGEEITVTCDYLKNSDFEKITDHYRKPVVVKVETK